MDSGHHRCSGRSGHLHHLVDRGGSGNRGVHVMDGQVSGGHTEAHGVGDVVHSLDNAVGVNVAVAAASDTVGGLDLLLGLVGAGEAVVVLTGIVLGVELGAGRELGDREGGGVVAVVGSVGVRGGEGRGGGLGGGQGEGE